MTHRKNLFLPLIVLLFLTAACKNVAALPEQKMSERAPFFLNGMNVAWINYAQDLTSFNEARFTAMLDDIASADGNAVRWWIHVNGSKTPLYDASGKVSGMPAGSIETLKKALDLAQTRGISVIPCLWSFDMLQDQSGVDRVANKRLVQDKASTDAYIANALLPILSAVGNHPAVFAWEVCNEPEGMTGEFGWSTDRVSMASVQAFVNRIAGAIHRFDSTLKVTNGSWSFRVVTDVDGFRNYYRNDRLVSAGGDDLGTLDFYSVHFYQQHFNDSLSPFHNPASWWELDKPIVVAEFAARGIVNLGGSNAGCKTSSTLTTAEAYRYLERNGYAGALSWTYSNHDGFGGFADAKSGMEAVSGFLP